MHYISQAILMNADQTPIHSNNKTKYQIVKTIKVQKKGQNMKKVYSYVIDCTHSKYVYTTKEKTIEAAKKAYKKFVKEFPMLAKSSFEEELKLNEIVYLVTYMVKE